jgi:large subunit ribosomal protein L31
MKSSIHPTYHKDATVTCACGSTFSVGSTVKDIRVELCSACHPFYTGKQKIIDTARRVDKFEQRAAAQTQVATTRVGKRAKKERDAARRKARSAALGAEK